jgi:hypothetical protein
MLPKEVEVPNNLGRNAYYIQSRNRPDDMFMYLKGMLSSTDGLMPDRDYKLAFDIYFASNATNCLGVGGSEASVWLKAGGSTLEPVPQLYPDNYLGINVAKGHQGEGGTNLWLIGSIWNGQECGEEPRYIMLYKTYEHPYPIHTTKSGAQLWFTVGTESGYESLTGVYYYCITVSATVA